MEQVQEKVLVKEAIEKELKTLFASLAEAKCDLTSPLVDAEGFPRSDVDVYTVRHARSRINELRYDLKRVMDEIQEALHTLHSLSRDGTDPQTTEEAQAATTNVHLDSPSCAASAPPDDAPSFLKIHDVAIGSPAHECGFEDGDEVIVFGTASAANHASLSTVATIVRDSENQVVTVCVRRRSTDTIIHMRLRPRKWSGAGLLGCRVVPL